MNDIYEQKARKYKYKYLKLKKEIEYTGEGGGLSGFIGRAFDTKANQLKVRQKTEQIANEVYDMRKEQDEAKARADAEAKARADAEEKARADAEEKARADAEAKAEAEAKLKHTDFIEKIKKLEEAVKNDIVPLYDNKKILGNIDESIFNNNNVKFNSAKPFFIDYNFFIDNNNNNKDPVKCFINSLPTNKQKEIKRTVINNLKYCKINIEEKNENENDSKINKLLLEETKINDRGRTFNYNDNYLLDIKYVKNRIIRNTDLYSLYDIIYDLYNNLNDEYKLLYESFFSSEKKYAIYTPNDLIDILNNIKSISLGSG